MFSRNNHGIERQSWRHQVSIMKKIMWFAWPLVVFDCHKIMKFGTAFAYLLFPLRTTQQQQQSLLSFIYYNISSIIIILFKLNNIEFTMMSYVICYYSLSSALNLGSWVGIFWPEENKYYLGTAAKKKWLAWFGFKNRNKTEWFVEYDDWEDGWIDISTK